MSWMQGPWAGWHEKGIRSRKTANTEDFSWFRCAKIAVGRGVKAPGCWLNSEVMAQQAVL